MPSADCQMPNVNSGSSSSVSGCRDSGLGEDFFQFAGPLQQGLDAGTWQDDSRNDQVQPIDGFVDFFFNDANL